MHILLSVTALPFHFMITYSGLIFLAFTYMPLIVTSSYGTGEDSQKTFFGELFVAADNTHRANSPAELASLGTMVAIAESQCCGTKITASHATNAAHKHYCKQ